jgi:predicted RNA binding protein YcfA (HicA-like mRNA interferase family)
MDGYYSAVIEQLKRAGYVLLRTGKGSHEIWTNHPRNQTVPRHLPSRHLANALMRQAGIRHRF